MGSHEVARRVLARAAAQLGSVESLAGRLMISSRLLQYYITGSEPVPDSLLLRVIDIVLEGLPEIEKHSPTSPQASHSLPDSKRDP
jgi:hypothetical protein